MSYRLETRPACTSSIDQLDAKTAVAFEGYFPTILLHLVEDGEGGAVGVFEGEGDEAAVGFELGDLVVIAVLGHVGPGA